MSRRLAELLVQTPPDVQPEDVHQLHVSGMAAEVASRLPQEHAMQSPLRPARLALAVRNQQIRGAMLPLLAAWQRVCIPSVLLKGFAFDQLEYAATGLRPFGDVDVLIHVADLAAAIETAQALGWTDDGLAARPREWIHEVAHLFSPDQVVQVDIHRHLVRRHRRHKNARLTAACWQASREVCLEKIPVRVLAPQDMALHLALTRVWGDRGLKAADYPDLRVLIDNHRLTPEAVTQRAGQLGVKHSWAAFLSVCDPWRAVFRLGEAEVPQQLRRAAWRDGQQLNWVWRLLLMPRFVWRLLLALPDVLAVRVLLRTPQRPQDLPARWRLGRTVHPLTPADRHDLIRGVYWLTRWLYPKSAGDCLPKALATHRALVRRGYPAVFVSGVRRTEAGQLEGHAWVEGPQGPLEEYEGGYQRSGVPPILHTCG